MKQKREENENVGGVLHVGERIRGILHIRKRENQSTRGTNKMEEEWKILLYLHGYGYSIDCPSYVSTILKLCGIRQH